MQEQQNIELYPKGTQNQSEIRCKSLEAVLSLDNEEFVNFLIGQPKLSNVIILDTSVFMPLSLDKIIEFIDHDQRDDIKEYIKRVFSKTQENLSYLNSALMNNKGFVITNEIAQEIYDWNTFWKVWINPENNKITNNSSFALKKNKEYILGVIKRNKSLHSLLKEHTRNYIASVINIRNFLINEKRVLSSLDSHQNYHFKTLLKSIIWGTKSKVKKEISEEDRKITYALFLNALNYPTGLMSMDEDFQTLTMNIINNMPNLNKTLKKRNLYIKRNSYNEKFFTYFIHVDHF